MKVILFGASGMVGQGVLRECLLDSEIESILSICRTQSGKPEAKLREIVQKDVSDLGSVEDELRHYDACFFCLGISSVGMKEEDYRRVTYDLTMTIAKTLVRLNPAMTFIFVSGTGADSTESGSIMWARIKGMAENGVLGLPFKAVCIFRPGIIQPLHGIASRTKIYRLAYAVLAPLFSIVRLISPGLMTTTEQVGRAMIQIAKRGVPKPILENSDINKIGV